MRDPCTMEADLSTGVMMMGAFWHVYFYSERACIMHAALTKYPGPNFTGVLSGVWLELSSWVGWCIKFLEALLPPAYACKYSGAASMCTQTDTHTVIHFPADLARRGKLYIFIDNCMSQKKSKECQTLDPDAVTNELQERWKWFRASKASFSQISPGCVWPLPWVQVEFAWANAKTSGTIECVCTVTHTDAQRYRLIEWL